MTPKISKKNSKKRLWIRGNIWERVKCTDLLTGPRCMVGPKRGMYTLYHSYIFRDCFNFWHSTTISHRKRSQGWLEIWYQIQALYGQQISSYLLIIVVKYQNSHTTNIIFTRPILPDGIGLCVYVCLSSLRRWSIHLLVGFTDSHNPTFSEGLL